MKFWKIFSGMLLVCLFVLGFSDNVKAAFPSDLDQKALRAYALTQEVTVYGDAALTQPLQNIAGDGFVFDAVDVTDDQTALYGNYQNTNTGESGQGYVSSSVFLVNPDFKHVYATVRAPMTIYSSSSLSKTRAHIKKYSGIIAVGKANGAIQVIYDAGSNYGMGWMAPDEYKNKLVYDGRDKQILADGTYTFSTLTDLMGQNLSSAFPFRLEYVSKKNYRIVDVNQNLYFKINVSPLVEEIEVEEPDTSWKKSGIWDTLYRLFSAEYREKYAKLEEQEKENEALQQEYEEKITSGLILQDQDNQLQYEISMTADPQDAGLFSIDRQGDYYSLYSKNNDLFLGWDSSSGQYVLAKSASLDFSNTAEAKNTNNLWRVRTTESKVNTASPMVITQYDPKWCGSAYGSEGCIGTAGCGILSTVNAVYALTGQYMDVMELADYAVQTGYRIEGSGTADGIFKAAAQTFGNRYGFAYDGKTEKLATLKKKLLSGDVAVSHVIGHYVAIVAYDPASNRYLLLDSNTLPKRATTAFGDWVSPSRLVDGYLQGQMYFFFKLSGN